MTERETDEVESLARLAARRRACYEVWPEFRMVHGERRKTGVAVRLCGEPDPLEHVTPGCRHCRSAYEDLKALAAWALPREARDSRYEIEPFDRGWHLPAGRDFRHEVVVEIRVLHTHDFDDPVNDCQARCLAEITGRLERLGVRRGVLPPAERAGADGRTPVDPTPAGGGRG